ncbi:hypothetical protein PoB_004912500 [Plakobranchus ocellatus]|uniref:Uncharacterized protein n=1 Tax=Plakobranchus ocellatus TaxID=259542 RepID=A0AAV4BU05_9GAST|nr:hypothetical protein PoB_004912500 [Plakobranchus ocellatus]
MRHFISVKDKVRMPIRAIFIGTGLLSSNVFLSPQYPIHCVSEVSRHHAWVQYGSSHYDAGIHTCVSFFLCVSFCFTLDEKSMGYWCSDAQQCGVGMLAILTLVPLEPETDVVFGVVS